MPWFSSNMKIFTKFKLQLFLIKFDMLPWLLIATFNFTNYLLGLLCNSQEKTCLWRTFETSSDLLLMRLTDDVKIWYFSYKYKLHLLDPYWYGLAWSITGQCMIGFSMPFLFISLKCLDSSVDMVFLLYLKELRCL